MSNAVAIVGMAGIFPKAPDLRTYWDNILNKVDAVGDPAEAWSGAYLPDAESAAPDRIYCKKGGFLRDGTDFNPLEYGIMPIAVDGAEPDHFLALKVAQAALEDATYLDRSFDRQRTEIIIGRGEYFNRGNVTALQHGFIIDQTLSILKEYHPEHSDAELEQIRQRLKASLPPFNTETAPGLVPNVICGRIANRFDFMGANYTIDAACASSLIALDQGVRDLLSHRCDLALVGGVHTATPPIIFMVFCQLNALSRRGQIRPFDKDADGTILGEGLGVIVLKRLEDAERDDDKIYAVVKGIGIASDGRALSVLAPRVEGEVLALERAYQNAGVSPQSVELIEAHGTGTLVGDATEIQALRQVFGARQKTYPTCALGSVKSMIGHTMPAAGIAGLIKATLALHHKVLPPTIHCDKPNPAFELGSSPFYLNTDARPWIHGDVSAPRRAGVSAFGFGGINAHVILEEYTDSCHA